MNNNYKKIRNTIISSIITGTIMLSTSGCAGHTYYSNDKLYDSIDEKNELAKDILSKIKELNENEKEKKYDYIDEELAKIGDIALLRVGNLIADGNDEYDYGFIDPSTGEEVIRLGVEEIYSDISDDNMLVIKFKDGSEEILNSNDLLPYINQSVIDTKKKYLKNINSALTKESKERTQRLQNAKDKELELYKIYSYVGEEKESKNGFKYREINTFNGEKNGYANGIVNIDLWEEIIPCEKYSTISKENRSIAGYAYRQVNTKYGEKNGYAPGRIICITGEEIIPTETYSYIDKEKKINGKNKLLFREVNTFEGERNNTVKGIINIVSGNVIIPCNTYTIITDAYKMKDNNKYFNVNTKEGTAKNYVYGIINIQTGEIILEPNTYIKSEEVQDGLIRAIKEDGTFEIKRYIK